MAVDLQSYYNDPAIESARAQAETAATQASAYQSAASMLPQKLREAIMSKMDYNKDLIESQNKAMAEYFQAPSAAREKYQDVWNPFQREKLVAQERAQAYQPYANLTDLLSQRMGTLSDMIGAGTGAFNASVTAQQNAAQLARQNYQDLYQRGKDLSGAAQAEEQLRLSALSAGGGGTASGIASSVLQQAANDARRGLTLNDIMQKYSTSAYVSPDDIFRIYNTNSVYGPAKESATELKRKYGVGNAALGITAEMINRQASLLPAQAAINQVKALQINQSGPQNRVAQVSLNYLGGLGVSQNLVSLNQNFELLRQNVVRALQGARMSDQDIKIAQGYIPSIIDTPETVKTKLDNLQKFLNSVSGKIESESSSDSTGSTSLEDLGGQYGY